MPDFDVYWTEWVTYHTIVEADTADDARNAVFDWGEGAKEQERGFREGSVEVFSREMTTNPQASLIKEAP